MGGCSENYSGSHTRTTEFAGSGPSRWKAIFSHYSQIARSSVPSSSWSSACYGLSWFERNCYFTGQFPTGKVGWDRCFRLAVGNLKGSYHSCKDNGSKSQIWMVTPWHDPRFNIIGRLAGASCLANFFIFMSIGPYDINSQYITTDTIAYYHHTYHDWVLASNLHLQYTYKSTYLDCFKSLCLLLMLLLALHWPYTRPMRSLPCLSQSSRMVLFPAAFRTVFRAKP